MAVLYRGNKLIPVQGVDITPTFNTNEQGEIISTTFDITVKGTLMAWKGSPTSSGSFWTSSGYPADESISQDRRLQAIMRKQQAMEELFGVQGGLFEIQSIADGTPIFRCNPQIKNINYPDGIWVEVCPYTINMTTNNIIGVNVPSGGYVKNTQENWQIELNEQGETDYNPQSFRLTHNVSAQGLLVYKSDGTKLAEPWQLARTWVQDRIGIDANIVASNGALNLPSYYGGYNHARSENVDEQTGVYSVSENWILASGNAIEDFTISSHTDLNTSLTTVSVNGSIQGLDSRNSSYQLTTTKYQAANTKFNTVQNMILSRAQNYVGVTLNPLAISQDVGRNPVAGTISYTYEYDTRPSNYINGAKTEIVTVVDSLRGDLFAVIPVLGRFNGPVLQSLASYTETTRQLTIEATFPVVSLGANQASVRSALNTNPRLDPTYSTYIQDIITAATPIANYVFVAQPQESWNPKTGAYSYNTTYVWGN